MPDDAWSMTQQQRQTSAKLFAPRQVSVDESPDGSLNRTRIERKTRAYRNPGSRQRVHRLDKKTHLLPFFIDVDVKHFLHGCDQCTGVAGFEFAFLHRKAVPI